jgi:hypothetical protein
VASYNGSHFVVGSNREQLGLSPTIRVKNLTIGFRLKKFVFWLRKCFSLYKAQSKEHFPR